MWTDTRIVWLYSEHCMWTDTCIVWPYSARYDLISCVAWSWMTPPVPAVGHVRTENSNARNAFDQRSDLKSLIQLTLLSRLYEAHSSNEKQPVWHTCLLNGSSKRKLGRGGAGYDRMLLICDLKKKILAYAREMHFFSKWMNTIHYNTALLSLWGKFL